jgi:hypothetical protein
MVFAHYRELVRPAQAEAFFGLWPRLTRWPARKQPAHTLPILSPFRRPI